MQVTPIASTVIHAVPFSIIDTEFGADMADAQYGSMASEIDTIAEFAGRSCYQSWSKPNEATATNAGYMANVISQGHESILEHGSVTFYVEDVSRALTHELIRHRHLSYSELSQRFVDMSEAKMIVPPTIRAVAGANGVTDADERFNSDELISDVREAYEDTVDALIGAGYGRKQAREAARCLMPNATETKIVVTGNLRAWRDVLKKRHSVHADAEIQEFAKEILGHLRLIAPNSVADIPEEPYQ